MRFYDDLTEWWPLVDEPSDATGVCGYGTPLAATVFDR